MIDKEEKWKIWPKTLSPNGNSLSKLEPALECKQYHGKLTLNSMKFPNKEEKDILKILILVWPKLKIRALIIMNHLKLLPKKIEGPVFKAKNILYEFLLMIMK